MNYLYLHRGPALPIATDSTTVPVATVFAGYIAYEANLTCGGTALAPLGIIGRGALVLAHNQLILGSSADRNFGL